MTTTQWIGVTDNEFKKYASSIIEWHAYQSPALGRVPTLRELWVFQDDVEDPENPGQVLSSTFTITFKLAEDNNPYVAPTLEEALAIYDNNSDTFQQQMLTLKFVKDTAATPKSTQALFGLLANRIKRLEQLADPTALASAQGYASFVDAKRETITSIFALDHAQFYGNLLH